MIEPVAPIARSVLQWIIVAAVAIMVVFGLFRRLDVVVSSLFFDAQANRFPPFFDFEFYAWRDSVLNVIISLSVHLVMTMRTGISFFL